MLDERFRIVSALTHGSLTEVYVAEQLSPSRKVTLTIFRAEPGAKPVLGDRFDTEVRRLAKVDHAAVVRVLDSGRSETTLFLVTELAEGPRLSDELKGEPLLPERALELLTQIADGLAAIHDQGLLHGDLRPATVLLAKGARGEQARLLDFGLDRLKDSASPDGHPAVIGAPPDVPTDLYAFGVLAYQVLAGVVPSRPAAKPLAEAAPHLADQLALCELVMRCLDQDAARRPGSALELAKQLAKLPRPTEPTIFLEAMQRPPPVPVAKGAPAAPPPLPPAAAPAAAQAPVAPRPLLASVETLIVPAQVQEGVVGAPRAASTAPASRRGPLLVAGAAVLLALAAGTVVFLGGSVKREARNLIERRQPVQALEILGKAQRKLSIPDPQLTALKVAALHLTEAHADEAAVFQILPSDAHEALDPLVLSGLVEDFSKKEEPGVRALLRRLPGPGLRVVLEGFAQEPLSPRQWGALRYLDLEQAAGGLSLVALYSASLESNDCTARKAAARRLGQLMDDASESALGRLRDAPREGAEKNCGQDEAQAALQALKKSR